MTQDDRIQYWKASALKDKQTATTLYTARDYHWSLFFWQLVLEKLLKSLILKRDKEPLFTHNLVNLAEEADISLTSTEREELREITTFNLEARYDDEKFSFYKKATKSYADHWIEMCSRFANTWEIL